MAFQNTVNFDQGFGVVGELAVDGPLRALAGVLDSSDPENNVVGRYFTRNGDGTFGAGGTGADGGILANPKTYAAQGTAAGGTLAPALTLRNGEIGEFVQMGEIIVAIDVAADLGDEIHYNETTGELTAVTPGSAPAGGFAQVPHAAVSRFAQAQAGGLIVAKLTN
jgi:hypothetical protein